MTNPIDYRLDILKTWLSSLSTKHKIVCDSLRLASSDASFRRYFRVDTDTRSLIIMDAPPNREDCTPFIHIAEKLQAVGIHCPRLIEKNLTQGFLLLTDLGEQTYYQRLQSPIDDGTLQTIYRDALASLVVMQKANANDLPVYDEQRLISELELFPEWYIDKYHAITLTQPEKEQLQVLFHRLAQHNAKQAKVFVHRDFHSPNLMLCDPTIHGPNPGIIDFQDALLGPITYDIASLVMDARTTWEEQQQLDWAIRYWEMARKAGLAVPSDFADFHIDYEYMGLQRNLRILGVFARLALRDNKKHYLAHIPRVNAYVRQVANRYIIFKPLLRLLDRLDNIETTVGYTF